MAIRYNSTGLSNLQKLCTTQRSSERKISLFQTDYFYEDIMSLMILEIHIECVTHKKLPGYFCTFCDRRKEVKIPLSVK